MNKIICAVLAVAFVNSHEDKVEEEATDPIQHLTDEHYKMFDDIKALDDQHTEYDCITALAQHEHHPDYMTEKQKENLELCQRLDKEIKELTDTLEATGVFDNVRDLEEAEKEEEL